ncbi:MAG: urease accessory UreF family protein [Myxococcota bacterium]
MRANFPRLFQLVSPALPVGSFAYSRGLETAVERGWIGDVATVEDWISGLLTHSVARLDGPLVSRLYKAWDDGGDVAHWIELAKATRETNELAGESSTMARALTRLLRDLSLASSHEAELAKEAFVAAFALAAYRLRIDHDACVEAFLWTWLESTVAAAVKLMPLGQTEGQRLLLKLGEGLPELARQASETDDDEIGALVPGLALASALHETQHTRLFRS